VLVHSVADPPADIYPAAQGRQFSVAEVDPVSLEYVCIGQVLSVHFVAETSADSVVDYVPDVHRAQSYLNQSVN